MPSLYLPMSGVNTKQKTIYAPMGGINTKQKTGYGLIGGVNTKVFSAGIPLSNLAVGSKLYLGTIYGGAIVWKVANISGNDITLITDKIIMIGAFDEAEPNNPQISQRMYGYSRYAYSNIHQWLNAIAINNWYVAQHTYDNPPTSSNQSYDKTPGFLSGFSATEIAKLKTKSIPSRALPNVGSGYFDDPVTARIWLPSCTEVNFSSSVVEGTRLALFSDNASRVAGYTSDVISRVPSVAAMLNDGYYWLRTAFNVCQSFLECSGATVSYNDDYNHDYYGVRPLCVLDSSTLLGETPDANGTYSLAA